MYGDVDRILYTREVIEERVKELAGQVVGVYREEPFVVAVALQGAFIFAADLVRHLPQAIEILFVQASSYEDATSPVKAPTCEIPAGTDLTGRHVLLVEDIVDTGLTLSFLIGSLHQRGARSVKLAALLDKWERREREVKIDYCGFQIPDAFVVGYGLDYDERYRNLPYIAVIRDPSIKD